MNTWTADKRKKYAIQIGSRQANAKGEKTEIILISVLVHFWLFANRVKEISDVVVLCNVHTLHVQVRVSWNKQNTSILNYLYSIE